MYLSLEKRNILCFASGILSLVVGIALLFPLPNMIAKISTKITMVLNLIFVFILIKVQQENDDEMSTMIALKATYKSFMNLIYTGFVLGLILSIAIEGFQYTLKNPISIGHIIFGVGYTSYFYLSMKYEKKGLC